MSFSYKHLLPQDFSDNSRVWIYQSDRPFNNTETFGIGKALNDFVVNWKSHGVPVKGFAHIFFDQFIILMADEEATGVSGCSIDSSVHVIQEIASKFNVDMLNWQSLAFIVDDKIQIISRQQFNHVLEQHLITTQTLFFNNVVTTKRDFEEKWIVPVNESWLKTKIKQAVS